MNDVPAATKHVDNEDDALMRFRTAWMRAIALAWMNKTERQLIANPLSFLKPDGWPAEWDRLKLQVTKEESFIWVGDTWTWVEEPEPAAGAQEDELQLWLPLSARIPEAQYALALSEYYKHRSSIFSKCPPDAPGRLARGASAQQFLSATLGGAHGFMMADGSRQGVHWQPNDAPQGGFVPAYSSFANLSVALVSALAKAWTIENYKARLLQDPESALHSTREYSIPWKLKLHIKDDHGPKWDATKLEWDFKKERTNVLVLCLPVRPTSGSNQALALAAYNASGAEYPFTCCP
jgi:ribosomally synthesized peptide (two-chain TOMM family)